MKLSELAELVDATVHGDGSMTVTGCAGLKTAGPDEITFLANANSSTSNVAPQHSRDTTAAARVNSSDASAFHVRGHWSPATDTEWSANERERACDPKRKEKEQAGKGHTVFCTRRPHLLMRCSALQPGTTCFVALAAKMPPLSESFRCVQSPFRCLVDCLVVWLAGSLLDHSLSNTSAL